ncbi:MAG: PAS domain S-box protein [Nitrospirae bacterium]|nr:PAS domain S-box protein [Nitrospirota bacterium]
MNSYRVSLNSHLNSVAEGLVPLLLSRQPDAIYGNLDALLMKNENWVGIELFDPQGRLLYPGDQVTVSKGHTNDDVRTFKQDIRYLDANLGNLAVKVCFTEKLMAIRKQQVMLFSILALVSALFFLTTGLILEFLVRKPIKQLQNAAREIGQGNLNVAIDIRSKDEVGELAASFNRMTSDLKTAQDSLLNYNAMLEKKVEERTIELTRTTDQISLMLDSLPIIPYTCRATEDFCATYIGKSVTRISGYQSDDFIVNPGFWANNIHPDDKLRAFEVLPILLEKGEHYHEYRWKSAEGTYLWFGDTLRLIRTPNGEPDHIVGTWQDITKRKMTEEKLKESEQKYISLVETTGTGYVIIDHEGRVLDANQIYIRLSGHNNFDEICGRSVVEWTAACEIEKNEKAVATCIKDGYIRNLEIGYVDSQGNVTSVEINASVLIKDGKPRILSLCRDITERKQKEDELRQALLMAESGIKARGEFLSNMSHELTTPLNSIIGFSQVMLDDISGALNEQQREYLQAIQQGGERLNEIYSELLQFASLESGELKVITETFLLNDLLKSSLLLFNEKANLKGVSLSLKTDLPSEIQIEADRGKLSQVMFSLLDNAVKFTPSGGSVWVQALLISDVGAIRQVAQEKGRGSASPLQDRDFIEISVADTGIGIKQEDMPRLFKSFQQLESVYTKKYKGTGIGLLLAQKLIELHGGRVWIESESGKGTTVTFVIPIKQNSEYRSQESE